MANEQENQNPEVTQESPVAVSETPETTQQIDTENVGIATPLVESTLEVEPEPDFLVDINAARRYEIEWAKRVASPINSQS